MPNRRKDKPMIRITVSVEPDVYAEIEKKALAEERSAAWVIRKAMRQYVGQSALSETPVGTP